MGRCIWQDLLIPYQWQSSSGAVPLSLADLCMASADKPLSPCAFYSNAPPFTYAVTDSSGLCPALTEHTTKAWPQDNLKHISHYKLSKIITRTKQFVLENT